LYNLNPTDRVALENLNTWALHFRGIESQRDIVVPPAVKNWKQLTLAEVEAQVKAGNSFFCGRDGTGSNAAIKILNDEVRKYVFALEGEKIPKQQVLDLESIKQLFAVTPKAAFEKKLKEIVVTDSEKRRLVMLAKSAGIDNAETYKLKAIENYTGTKIE
jgi:hypothetical protein